MKKLIQQSFLYITAAVFILTGCKKGLEIDPAQSIDADAALTSRDGINAAIVSVYSKLKSARQYGRDVIAFPEALSDNGYATNKSGRLLPEANNVNRAHFGDALWQNSYFAINEINLILEAIPSLDVIPVVTESERNTWEGQLYFLRALYHFDIAKAYAYFPGAVVPSQDKGGIPIMLKGTKTSADALALKPSRSSVDDVYAQIITDFEAANSKLTGTGVGGTANRVAAQALLSRVNLYRKDYAEAKRWADSCIALAGNRLATAASYVSQWRAATHVETLFQVAFTVNGENIGVNESLQTSFTTLTAPGNTAVTGGFGDLVPSISLLNALGIQLTGGNTSGNFITANAAIDSRTDDVRNLLYEPGGLGRGKSYVECTKFLGKNGFINLDNVPVIRIAEVYLNRAEAMSTPGSPVLDEVAALDDLNLLATNRGLTDFVLTGSDLYEEVLNQRRIELAYEGHRFWDLKRLGRDVIKSPHYNDVNFTDVRILAPLPQRELDGNSNLVQNEGY